MTMLSKSHFKVSIGIWATVTIYTVYDITNAVGWAALAIGTLLPDIDHPTSKISRKLWFVSWIIHALFKHRTLTHSVWPVCAAIGISYYYSWHMHIAVAGFVVGYLSHLFGDWMTKSGVYLLWPLKWKSVNPLPFKTGSAYEYVIANIIMVAPFMLMAKGIYY